MGTNLRAWDQASTGDFFDNNIQLGGGAGEEERRALECVHRDMGGGHTEVAGTPLGMFGGCRGYAKHTWQVEGNGGEGEGRHPPPRTHCHHLGTLCN